MKLTMVICLLLSFAACSGTQTNVAKNASTGNAASSPSTIDNAAQTVTIDSPDGLKLVGSLYPAPNPHAAALLLLHQWQSDRHSYDDFAKRMQAKGFAVLSIDGRGFGESYKKADDSTVTAGRSDADVKAMLGDVGAAFNYLSKQANVDPKRVGIVGASYGSSLALIYAAGDPAIAAVAVVSPGINYFGDMQTEPAIKKYGDRPLLLIAAEDDKESADALRTLAGDGPRAAQHIYTTGGHGTALFKVGLGDELERFFAAELQK